MAAIQRPRFQEWKAPPEGSLKIAKLQPTNHISIDILFGLHNQILNDLLQ